MDRRVREPGAPGTGRRHTPPAGGSYIEEMLLCLVPRTGVASRESKRGDPQQG